MTARTDVIIGFHAARGFSSRAELEAAQHSVAAAYRELTPPECLELMTQAMDEGNAELLSALAGFQPDCFRGRHRELLARGCLYPPHLFYNADTDATKTLIQLVEKGSDEHRNVSLLALAWAGNSTAVQAFQRWRRTPPAWRETLYIPPEDYTDAAGWELTNTGERRDLVQQVCVPMVSRNNPQARRDPVQTMVPAESPCPWCGRRLTVLFDLKLDAPELDFLKLTGTRLRILTCDVCTCFGPIFSRVDWLGAAEWHSRTHRPEFLPEDSEDWSLPPENVLALSGEMRSATEAIDRNQPISFSQIGGYPSWEQDAEYPKCPDCRQRMPFIGQISNADCDDCSEGLYYGFLCTECQVAATCYQQT